MAPGNNIVVNGAAFADTFNLAGGVTVEMYKNPLTSLIERVYGGGLAKCIRFDCFNQTDASGTFNTVAVGPGLAVNSDRLSRWKPLAPSSDEGFIGQVNLPCGYVPQSDITVKVNYAGDGTGANNVVLQFGALFVEAGTIANTGESYANQTPSGPHTVAVTATADSMQYYSFALDGSAIPVGVGEGDTLNFVLFRNGLSAGDGYGGTLQIYHIDFTFATN